MYTVIVFIFLSLSWKQGQSQLYHNQNQGLLSQQGQSKDMPPRFSKKGQLNADEVCPWKRIDTVFKRCPMIITRRVITRINTGTPLLSSCFSLFSLQIIYLFTFNSSCFFFPPPSWSFTPLPLFPPFPLFGVSSVLWARLWDMRAMS